MQERPIILFPEPEKADRATRPSARSRIGSPSFGRQYSRLQPAFTVLRSAFDQKNIIIQDSPIGINPEFALVFEVVGTVESFYTAVNNVDGLEWMFDTAYDDIEPDDDFYSIDEHGNRSDKKIDGKLYCVMTNQQAMSQLLSSWERYNNGEDNVFPRGYTGLKDVFLKLKNIRKWNANDRIDETHIMDYWHEELEFVGDNSISFEIELFYRATETKRNIARQSIAYEINRLGGRIVKECLIDGIAYHSLLVGLPRASIESMINQFDEIALAQVDDIMFFRPTCQSAFLSKNDTIALENASAYDINIENDPIIALLDGMPIQNHPLLRGRVIVDDPDLFAEGYESKWRVHGTAMASLILNGDLNNSNYISNKPIYVRPILKPKEVGIDEFQELVPDDVLIVDLVHRAIVRMMEGDGESEAVAPSIKVINFSIGDPVRQLAVVMSPLARLLDFLANKYRILFIVSAGNHPEILNYVGHSFEDIRDMDMSIRNAIFFGTIVENQRNLKILSPAENINGLTVGAIYDDFCTIDENNRAIYAVEKGMPSPISAFGKGYRSIITPDLYYRGGRKLLINTVRNDLKWLLSSREPGCKVAAPFGDSAEAGQAFSFGTSDAAALLSHEASKCYDILNQIYLSETGSTMEDEFVAILLKAMLTHGASWGEISDKLASVTNTEEKRLARWVGNGIPNISRVEECAKNRITLIGTGYLKKDEGHVYKLPLPIDFSSRLVRRRLTVTLAYMSPIEPHKQAYRTVQMWFTIENGKKLVPDRQNTEWQAVMKGTLQHEIFTGENPEVWNDNDEMVIKVNCREDAGKLQRSSIPYCIFVTFEVAEALNIDIYAKVSLKIKPMITA